MTEGESTILIASGRSGKGGRVSHGRAGAVCKLSSCLRMQVALG